MSTIPRLQRSHEGARVRSSPPNRRLPESTGNSPPRQASRLDFPAPFSPMMPTIVPRGTSKETSWTTRSPPRRTDKVSSSSLAVSSKVALYDLGIGEHVLGRSLADRCPGVHRHHPVCDAADCTHVVLDHQHGQPPPGEAGRSAR